jgi:ATP sulfurylase
MHHTRNVIRRTILNILSSAIESGDGHLLVEPITGLTNATGLAEAAAEALDLYIDQIDWEIPDVVWDVAAEVAAERDETL